MKVAGIDGAPGGWMVAAGTLDAAEPPKLAFHPTLDALIAEVGSTISHIVVDMPLGLSADGNRTADRDARDRLGSRRATFFPTPVRAVLDHDDFDSANAASREVSGRGLSMQSWNLVPKIRELDRLVEERHHRIILEGHPESSFAELAGAPLASKKSTPEGRDERVALLAGAVHPDVGRLLAATPKRVDAIDALVLLWTARRVAAGTAVRLGDPDERDPAGRPMWLTI